MLQQQLTTLHNQTQLLSDSNTMLQQQLDTALFAGQLSIYPVLLCLPPPPQAITGSATPITHQHLCTVPCHVVLTLEGG